jgi:hypothetical protein
MTNVGSGLIEGVTEVAVAGTRVQLTTEEITFTAKTVVIQALSTNEEEVVVGGKGVVAKAGAHGAAEQKGISLAAKGVISIDIDDPRKVYLDSRKAKDGVSWVVLGA